MPVYVRSLRGSFAASLGVFCLNLLSQLH